MNSHLPLTARLHDYEECKREREQEDTTSSTIHTSDTLSDPAEIDVVENPDIADVGGASELDSDAVERDDNVEEGEGEDGDVGSGSDTAGAIVNDLKSARPNMVRRETEIDMRMEEKGDGKGGCRAGTGRDGDVEAEANIRDTGDLDIASELDAQLREKGRRETEGW